MSNTITIEDLKKAVSEDAAIRGRGILQPAGGKGDKIFPPTHRVGDRDKKPGAKYAREKRRLNGEEHEVVLLDSVQSQANRMEEALQFLWSNKTITLPVITIDFGTDFPDLRGISSLNAPHRISDALLRDSLLDGTLFRYSPLGQSFSNATPSDASSLFKVCPTALLFGLWDSTGPRGGLGFKLARNLTSEIVGIDAVFGTKSSSRIDPAGIVKDAGKLFEAANRQEQWTLSEADARMEPDSNGDQKPVPYGKDGKPSSANHGNIPPTLDPIAGGVTIEYATQTVVLSLAGLRRLLFGANPEDNIAARTVLAVLGLLAVTASADRGYDLRSRCQLVPEPEKALSFERIAKNGNPTDFSLDLPTAISLFNEAVNGLPDSLKWRKGDTIEGDILKNGEEIALLRPAPKLLTLIAESRSRAAAGETGDDEE